MPSLRQACVWFSLMLVVLPAAHGGLQDEIAHAIHASGLNEGQVSVAVRDAPSGTLLAGIASKQPRIPASNQKLLSSGLAARVLGADFHFQTRLLQQGRNLIVLGDGDPGLADDVLLEQMRWADGHQLTSSSLLDLWVTSVHRHGITHVDTLIIDDRIFDRTWRHPDWDRDDWRHWYGAPVAGLNFSCNTMSFRPVPRGSRVDISDAWPDWGDLHIDNDLKPGRHGHDQHVIGGHSSSDGRLLQLRGTVTKPTTRPIEISIEVPPLRFGHMLANRLRAAGIQVDEVRLADSDDPPATGKDVAPPILTPLTTALQRCNGRSYNLYAEALLKRAAHEVSGRPGSWEEGRRVLTRNIEQVAGPSNGLNMADGSGLSRRNMISAHTLSAWLCDFDPHSPADACFLNSLPGPGEGTIKNRFDDNDLQGATLQAKTGYIRSVYALSGILTCPDGARRTFSILINGTRDGRRAKRLHERIVELIASYCD